ncbi:hypothetical protein QEH53_21260 [Pelagicoccus sp. SDUM812002]|nr:hypothetical protein [Pelagicoccus sp. SDUM812002]
MKLSWDDRSHNEDGFWIERSDDGINFTEIGESAANEATFLDDAVSTGNRYYYRVQSFNAYGASEYSDVADVLVGDEDAELRIPNEPESTVIGEMSVLGESVFDVGARSFVVSASGAGYEQYLDELRFTQVEADGDFVLRVKVHAFEGDDRWARVGLMVRESLEQDARHESVVMTGDGYIERLSRLAKGMKVAETRQTAASGSVYFGVERRDGYVHLSYSLDGQVWEPVSGPSNELSGRVHVGISIGSQIDGRLSAALVEVQESDLNTFSKYSAKWPYLLGKPIEEHIIGDLEEVGSYSYDANRGVHFLEASGVGYERFDDELRFSKVTVSGDVDFSVRLSDLRLDSTWGRAGIMIRSSVEQSAAHLSVVVNGFGKFETLVRKTDGAQVVESRFSTAPEVGYLRISKTGNLVKGYTSTDGEAWSLVIETQIQLGESFDAGLAIGSQYDGRLSRCRFEVLYGEEADGPLDPEVVKPAGLAILGQTAVSSIVGEMSDEGKFLHDDSGLYYFSASGLGYETYKDALRYSWVPAVSDFSLRVALYEYVADDDWSRVGLMVRESLSPDAAHASVVLCGYGGFETLVRPSHRSEVIESKKGTAGSYPQLRLDRVKETIRLYVADNGGQWRLVEELDLSLGSHPMIGLSIGSQRDGALSSSVVEVLD